MKRTSLRLQELIHQYLQQAISPKALSELLDYAKDPSFEDEIKEKLSMIFKEVNPKELEEEEQDTILKNIFEGRNK